MPQVNESAQERVVKFLCEFKVPEAAPKKPPTLMEIAQFPHRETVVSNILAFFLDSGQVHNFDELFVRSMVEIYHTKCQCESEEWRRGIPQGEEISEIASVEREVHTSDGKFIDLVVECTGFQICIENKVYSGLHNDLKHYREFLEKGADDVPIIGIVLSPSKIDAQKVRENRFVNITFEEFVERIRINLGLYLNPENTQYQYLLFDFLDHVQHFRNELMNEEDKAFLEIWRSNFKSISYIEENSKNLIRLLKAEKLAEAHIKEIKKRHGKPGIVSRYWTVRSGGNDIAVFDMQNKDETEDKVALDVRFHPLEVKYVLFARTGNPDLKSLVKDVVKDCKIEFSEVSEQRKPRYTCAVKKSPFESAVCDEVADLTAKILDTIKRKGDMVVEI